jgi:tetratricopeptide (TPR) repeat protein
MTSIDFKHVSLSRSSSMARDTITRGPNVVHPEKPSAVGSRNSANRNNRDEYKEAKVVIDEEVDKILNHVHAKLPPEVLEKLDVMGSLKSKLHNYFNQDYQNMLNRYLVTMEDEMGKKFRDLVDKEEHRALNRYTPREVSDILDRIGGADKFNTSEIEKSVVNMYGHLQGHIQRGINELETHTNSLLREKTDVGAFVRGENAYAIVKCSFRDNSRKPKSVVDLKLSINILDSELISPIYHYQVPVAAIIKDVVAKHIHDLIDKEIDELNASLVDAGKEELSDTETIFERFRIMDSYVADEGIDDEKRYQFVAKGFLDAVDGLQAEIDSSNYDALNIRENIKKIIDAENIRNRGFNTAVNSLTAILDTSKMGYQHIENFKNARECIIREYEAENDARLPDERYAIRLVYYDAEQLRAMRQAYTKQIDAFEREIGKLWKVCNSIYLEDRGGKGYDDWDTLSESLLNQREEVKKSFFKKSVDTDEDEMGGDESEKLWDEITFVDPKETVVESSNPTYEGVLDKQKTRFPIMRKQLEKVFGHENAEERRVVQKRINFIESELDQFTGQINPYHIQQGLILDVDIVSIKRKRTTMMNMANVLNEFLFSVSKGFADAAFAGFSRRRSTTRDDIDQDFGMGEEE